MFAPSHVTEPKPNALYEQLILATGDQPKWNFYKYLIGRDGKVAGVYPSLTSPDNKDFVAKNAPKTSRTKAAAPAQAEKGGEA